MRVSDTQHAPRPSSAASKDTCLDRIDAKRLCAEWDAPGQNALRTIGQHHTFGAGTRLCEQGTDPLRVFLVESGTVALTLIGSEGGEYVVGLRSSGSIIGSANAVNDEPLAFTAFAASNVEAVALERTAFIHAYVEHHAVTRYVADAFIRERLADLHEREQFLSLTAAQRLEDLFWELAMTAHPTTEVRLPFAQTFLAQWLGVSPEHVSSVIRGLEKRGAILRLRRGRFLILRPELLFHTSNEKKFPPT